MRAESVGDGLSHRPATLDACAIAHGEGG
jgi:hypothetical protein